MLLNFLWLPGPGLEINAVIPTMLAASWQPYNFTSWQYLRPGLPKIHIIKKQPKEERGSLIIKPNVQAAMSRLYLPSRAGILISRKKYASMISSQTGHLIKPMLHRD